MPCPNPSINIAVELISLLAYLEIRKAKRLRGEKVKRSYVFESNYSTYKTLL